jgi:hypothetical protein
MSYVGVRLAELPAPQNLASGHFISSLPPCQMHNKKDLVSYFLGRLISLRGVSVHFARRAR